MTRNKTISSLSIAAIALFAAAAPSFAQVQSDQSGKNTQTSISAPVIEQTLAFNREVTGSQKTRVTTLTTPLAPTARPLMLSPRTFKVHNQFTSSESGRFVMPQASFDAAGPKDPGAKKQFRADDDNPDIRGRKHITFVPSRGQKLPE